MSDHSGVAKHAKPVDLAVGEAVAARQSMSAFLAQPWPQLRPVPISHDRAQVRHCIRRAGVVVRFAAMEVQQVPDTDLCQQLIGHVYPKIAHSMWVILVVGGRVTGHVMQIPWRPLVGISKG